MNLVARLEAARRAHLDAPDAARAAFARVIDEAASALAKECQEVLGDDAQARLIEREARDTILPRYTRMALAQNKVEARGYGGVIGDGLVARVGATVGMLLLATIFSRFLPGFTRELAYVLVAFTPFVPELRLALARRSWRAQLQELADDMGQVQDSVESMPAGGTRATATEDPPDPTPPRPPTRQEVR